MLNPPPIVPLSFRNTGLSNTPFQIGGNGQGIVLSWRFINTGAALSFIKLYDKATTPTVGTDIPIEVIPVYSNGVSAADPTGAQLNALIPRTFFSNGLWIVATANIGDSDNTPPATALFAQLKYVQ